MSDESKEQREQKYKKHHEVLTATYGAFADLRKELQNQTPAKNGMSSPKNPTPIHPHIMRLGLPPVSEKMRREREARRIIERNKAVLSLIVVAVAVLLWWMLK